MSVERSIEVHALHWRGVDIEIAFERDWLSLAHEHSLAASHLTVTAVQPERAPLPITETGYRSHVLHSEEVDEAGRPVSYVEAWLDHFAKSLEWTDLELARRQYLLI